MYKKASGLGSKGFLPLGVTFNTIWAAKSCFLDILRRGRIKIWLQKWTD